MVNFKKHSDSGNTEMSGKKKTVLCDILQSKEVAAQKC